MNNPCFRLATPQDLEAMHHLNAQSFAEAWSRQAFDDAWHHGYDMVLYIGDKGDLIAYYLAQSIVDETEIMQVTVSKKHREEGIGFALMRYALDLKPEQHFFLEVRESNQAAIALYQKLAFQIVDRRKKYYKARVHAEREDALVMSYASSKKIGQ
ncbi:MAG: ribosomal protein S18-alanine N-acetyltransferase [Mariprofundaceae bacterium]|nr:ribosomal protein S18-alanine N-acetyltransferase [Mariprofundaceae bacterium]